MKEYQGSNKYFSFFLWYFINTLRPEHVSTLELGSHQRMSTLQSLTDGQQQYSGKL